MFYYQYWLKDALLSLPVSFMAKERIKICIRTTGLPKPCPLTVFTGSPVSVLHQFSLFIPQSIPQASVLLKNLWFCRELRSVGSPGTTYRISLKSAQKTLPKIPSLGPRSFELFQASLSPPFPMSLSLACRSYIPGHWQTRSNQKIPCALWGPINAMPIWYSDMSCFSTYLVISFHSVQAFRPSF